MPLVLLETEYIQANLLSQKESERHLEQSWPAGPSQIVTPRRPTDTLVKCSLLHASRSGCCHEALLQQELTDLPANTKYQKCFEQWHSPKKIPTLKGMVIWSLSQTLYHTSYGSTELLTGGLLSHFSQRKMNISFLFHKLTSSKIVTVWPRAT